MMYGTQQLVSIAVWLPWALVVLRQGGRWGRGAPAVGEIIMVTAGGESGGEEGPGIPVKS